MTDDIQLPPNRRWDDFRASIPDDLLIPLWSLSSRHPLEDGPHFDLELALSPRGPLIFLIWRLPQGDGLFEVFAQGPFQPQPAPYDEMVEWMNERQDKTKPTNEP